MLSTKSAVGALSLSLFSVLASASFALNPHPHVVLPRDDGTPVACYTSSSGMEDQGTYPWQSIGHCQPICTNLGKAVFAMTNGNDCWCGDSLPPSNSKVDMTECSLGCTGFPANNCGGQNAWAVYLTGSKSLSQLGGSSSSSSASQASNLVSTSTIAQSGQTIVVTAPASSDNSGSQKSGGSNTAGIAAGIVVGILALSAIVGGLFFFLRRRRRQAADEEHRRQNQVSDFMRGTKEGPPNSSYSQMSDQRLDPGLNKRNSVGSLADEQDYSRRILRVANPDSYR